MTVNQCREIIRLQDKIDCMNSLLVDTCPPEVARLIRKTIRYIEDRRDKLLNPK